MKRNKNPDGYRTRILNVRLTEIEDATLKQMYENARINNPGLLISDFVRKQLLYENSDGKLKEIYNDVRKLRTEVHQSLMMVRQLEDDISKKHFCDVITAAEKKIDDLKKKLEGLYGDNGT